MYSSLRTYSIEIPFYDVAFFNEFILKMGWVANETSLKTPCQITKNELRNEVMQSVNDAEKGLGITIAEARKRHLAV